MSIPWSNVYINVYHMIKYYIWCLSTDQLIAVGEYPQVKSFTLV